MVSPGTNLSLVRAWLEVKGWLAAWLIHPEWVVVPMAALLLGLWRFRRYRWGKPLMGVLSGFVLVYFLVLLPPVVSLANLGLVSWLPVDTGAKADAIVVLGRGVPLQKSRVDVAEALWHQGRAPIIFVSGTGDSRVMRRSLLQQGIPATAVQGENKSRTTEENARLTALMLQPQGVKQIILVTDPPHLLRSLLTFQSYGFTVIPHPSPLPSQIPPPKQALLVFQEYGGLLSYGLQGRFFARTILPPSIEQNS